MTLDSPAGRLHALLEAFTTQSESGGSFAEVWSGILGTTQDQVLPALARVAGLLPETEAALARAGDQRHLDAFVHFAPIWARAIFAPDQNMGQTSPNVLPGLIDRGALLALGSIAAFLSTTASEGRVPAPDTLESMRKQTVDMLSDLRAAVDLDDRVRKLLLDHVHALAWALDDLKFGGPGAVIAASERLASAIVLNVQPHARRSTRVRRAVALAALLWTGFKMGPSTQDALEAWAEIGGGALDALS